MALEVGLQRHGAVGGGELVGEADKPVPPLGTTIMSSLANMRANLFIPRVMMHGKGDLTRL